MSFQAKYYDKGEPRMYRPATAEEVRETRGALLFLAKDFSVRKARIMGKLRTWKTRPAEFELPVKYGLYEHWRISHRDIASWSAGMPVVDETEVPTLLDGQGSAVKGRPHMTNSLKVRGLRQVEAAAEHTWWGYSRITRVMAVVGPPVLKQGFSELVALRDWYWNGYVFLMKHGRTLERNIKVPVRELAPVPRKYATKPRMHTDGDAIRQGVPPLREGGQKK